MSSSDQIVDRQRWLALLARATPEELIAAWQALPTQPEYVCLRRPETGLVMVRGRAGGTGQRFNLGEMTVTRAAVRLDDDTTGHGYLAGRNAKSALLIAVFDALLQAGRDTAVIEQTLDAVRRRIAREQQSLRAKAAATRVNFSTLAREATT